MFNDLTTPLSFLATRRSGKPRDMIAPGPDADQLRAIVSLAGRVPDHGKLAPWRFVVVGPDRRDAFAALLQAAYRIDKPDAGRAETDAIDQFAHQAPTLVVVLSSPRRDSKIPLWEQELSAGAACMQLLNAAGAHGFVGGWLTGWAAFSPTVRDAFGTEDERIAGFVFIGSPARPLDERPRPDMGQILSFWQD
ncbi:nitroreductase [Sphingomonas sp. Leaf33]|uniref:nitroreductase family protein n=1 Tax=Sphingomonas sp. Leaf33 TaxID=1736215 RepID=UPI0006FE0896|nr:nitroreductase [Sphingomonas sp. Leaf33]KQN25586.1 nitroreductase [Sphingomonas sp. Leaf33]